ncbi:hypothetical protein L1D14_26815 [Vibrio tubiashii]|uniref:hypothetical protein n=1 Tax=Vibrio tubiashii TaxID=29498 RepID=UPI001EFE4E5C|nr:hypothetical protein [Vibrio tubiashii]MCG9579818.1 hypothetical protein [Vibrio tubiashii]
MDTPQQASTIDAKKPIKIKKYDWFVGLVDALIDWCLRVDSQNSLLAKALLTNPSEIGPEELKVVQRHLKEAVSNDSVSDKEISEVEALDVLISDQLDIEPSVCIRGNSVALCGD